MENILSSVTIQFAAASLPGSSQKGPPDATVAAIAAAATGLVNHADVARPKKKLKVKKVALKKEVVKVKGKGKGKGTVAPPAPAADAKRPYNSKTPAGLMICFPYQSAKSCQRDGCTMEHVCAWCFGDHPAHKCTEE